MIDIQRLTLGDNTFTYRVCGSGPDVLLIHGWTGTGRFWESLMQELAPHFRVWAIDLVGFGDSRNAHSAHSFSIDNHVELVVAFCESLGISANVIIGHSMGGAIAIKLALDYPAWLAKLVLVSPVVTGSFGWLRDHFLGSGVGRALLGVSQHIWPLAIRSSRLGARALVQSSNPEVLTRVLDDLQKSTWAAAHGGLLSMINIRLDRRLHEIRVPVLIISGSLDKVIPPQDSRSAAALIVGAQLLELPHCHHQTPDEDPDRFHQTVREFLVSA